MAGLADALSPPGLDGFNASDDSIIVDIEGPGATIQHDDGTIETPTESGGVVVSFNAGVDGPPGIADKFNSNLAPKLDEVRLSRIAEELIEQIEADIQSRSEWLTLRAEAIKLLGFKIEDPKADVGSSSSPMEGMSTFYDTLLAESCLRAHATACGELLPAEGPVKVSNSGTGTEVTEAQAEALEKDLNYWLTSVAKEYYPDTKRMLFLTVFAGCGFKKGLHDPIRRRPVIESVDAKDVIVSAEATDVTTAARVTHRIKMRPSVMRRMQVLKVYRDIDLTPPSPAPKDAATQATESISGVRTGTERPEETPYNLYETYAEVDINEFAPTQFKGKRLPLPFRVTIDVDSRQVLDIRRDWEEKDDRCLRKRTWVKYPYIEALTFYCIGLMHVVGNLTLALSAAGREGIDAGMMANFPGLLVAKWAARSQAQNTNMRINAGEAAIIDTGDKSIRDAVMGVPYHDVTQGLMSIMQALTEKGKSIAGTADLPVGEGKQDAPVGTTIALIEQATKVESNIHKGLHTAQCEELEVLERLFREDPQSFWTQNPECTMAWDEQTFLAALDNCMIVPRADPNTPSHIHRLLKAMGLKQLQAQNPGLYDPRAVDKRILTGMGWDDVDDLFVKPPPPGTPPPPPDPNQVTAQAKMITAQSQAQGTQIKAAQLEQQGQQKAQELAAEAAIERERIQKELIIHGDQHALDVANHGLDAVTAGHDAGLGAASHALDAHQALNPPEPAATP
jgi:hypothetical protein